MLDQPIAELLAALGRHALQRCHQLEDFERRIGSLQALAALGFQLSGRPERLQQAEQANLRFFAQAGDDAAPSDPELLPATSLGGGRDAAIEQWNQLRDTLLV